jgi:hypothetical protein
LQLSSQDLVFGMMNQVQPKIVGLLVQNRFEIRKSLTLGTNQFVRLLLHRVSASEFSHQGIKHTDGIRIDGAGTKLNRLLLLLKERCVVVGAEIIVPVMLWVISIVWVQIPCGVEMTPLDPMTTFATVSRVTVAPGFTVTDSCRTVFRSMTTGRKDRRSCSALDRSWLQRNQTRFHRSSGRNYRVRNRSRSDELIRGKGDGFGCMK